MSSTVGDDPDLWTIGAGLRSRHYGDLMEWRRAVTSGVVAVLAFSVAACAPSPDPTASPTDPTLDRALETHSGYIDALNRVDLENTSSFSNVLQWLTGSAREDEEESLQSMHSERWTVTGESEIVSQRAFLESDSIFVDTCVDISKIDVVNVAGESQVSGNRADRYSVRLRLVPSDETSTGFQIESSESIEDEECLS